MNPMKLLVAAVAVMAFEVHASAGDTWSLSKLETPTADAAETDAIYGYQTFANESSQVTVNVADGAINLIASKIASDGTEGYTANIGLLLPLTPDWREHDLTGLTSITFEYQNDATITDVLSVSLGSTAYSDAIAKAGTVYSNDIAGATALKGGTTWKQGEVLIGDFIPPSWWTDIPDDFPSLDTVLKHVKNLQFAPKTAYLSKAGSQNGTACTGACVDPSMKSITLKIRSIVLHGVNPPSKNTWPPFPGTGCGPGKSFELDGFAGGEQNTLGGDWFATSDFDSTGNSADPSTGSTVVTESINTDGPYLTLDAQLKKKVGTAYHKFAGWAAVGTNFGQGKALNASGLTGIGFQMADLGTNADLVQMITLKVKIKGVHDTAVHQFLLAAGTLVEAKNTGIQTCITPSQLSQPSYVVVAERSPFDASKIEQISWEAKITDDRNPAIDTATASFILANVVLYGVDAPVVGVRTQVRTKTTVGYANGHLHLSGFTGATRFEVRRLDGQLVAAFDASRGLGLALPRGTYLLSATGSDRHVTHKFAVLDR